MEKRPGANESDYHVSCIKHVKSKNIVAAGKRKKITEARDLGGSIGGDKENPVPRGSREPDGREFSSRSPLSRVKKEKGGDGTGLALSTG